MLTVRRSLLSHWPAYLYYTTNLITSCTLPLTCWPVLSHWPAYLYYTTDLLTSCTLTLTCRLMYFPLTCWPVLSQWLANLLYAPTDLPTSCTLELSCRSIVLSHWPADLMYYPNQPNRSFLETAFQYCQFWMRIVHHRYFSYVTCYSANLQRQKYKLPVIFQNYCC